MASLVYNNGRLLLNTDHSSTILNRGSSVNILSSNNTSIDTSTSVTIIQDNQDYPEIYIFQLESANILSGTVKTISSVTNTPGTQRLIVGNFIGNCDTIIMNNTSNISLTWTDSYWTPISTDLNVYLVNSSPSASDISFSIVPYNSSVTLSWTVPPGFKYFKNQPSYTVTYINESDPNNRHSTSIPNNSIIVVGLTNSVSYTFILGYQNDITTDASFITTNNIVIGDTVSAIPSSGNVSSAIYGYNVNIDISGGNSLTFLQKNTYIGTTNIHGTSSVLSIATSDSLGPSSNIVNIYENGALNCGGNSIINPFVLSGNGGTIGNGIIQSISGSAPLLVKGSLVINGNNPIFTGDINIPSGGVLTIETNNSISTSNVINVFRGSTLYVPQGFDPNRINNTNGGIVNYH